MSPPAEDGDQPGLWPLTGTNRPEKAERTRKTGNPAAGNTKPRGHGTRSAASRRPGRRAAAPDQPGTPEPITNLWCIDEVSRYLAISKDTIYGWRKTHYGPPAIKIGKHLRWRPEGVIAWAKERERRADCGL